MYCYYRFNTKQSEEFWESVFNAIWESVYYVYLYRCMFVVWLCDVGEDADSDIFIVFNKNEEKQHLLKCQPAKDGSGTHDWLIRAPFATKCSSMQEKKDGSIVRFYSILSKWTVKKELFWLGINLCAPIYMSTTRVLLLSRTNVDDFGGV